jgi:TetR/AcrR family transcriptional regulator
MTDSDRKSWEQQQRSNRIVDKAQAIFFESGYEKTTLPAIADAAGYNKRTLYLYFKDKEEIFLAVVLRGLIQLRTALAMAIERTDSESSGLRNMAKAFFDFSIHNPEYADLIMIYESRYFAYHDFDHSGDADSYRERCQQISEDMAHMVTSAIATGLASGSIRTNLTPHQLMLLLWGQIFGVMKIFRMRQRHFEAAFGIRREDLFNHFVAMVERSLEP